MTQLFVFLGSFFFEVFFWVSSPIFCVLQAKNNVVSFVFWLLKSLCMFSVFCLFSCMFYYGKNHENECWSLDFSCDFFSYFLCSTTEKQWYYPYVLPFSCMCVWFWVVFFGYARALWQLRKLSYNIFNIIHFAC